MIEARIERDRTEFVNLHPALFGGIQSLERRGLREINAVFQGRLDGAHFRVEAFEVSPRCGVGRVFGFRLVSLDP